MSKVDEQCTGDNDGTYAIKSHIWDMAKDRGKWQELVSARKKPKWLVKLKKNN